MHKIFYRILASFALMSFLIWGFYYLRSYGQRDNGSSDLQRVTEAYYKKIYKSLPGAHTAYGFLCQNSKTNITEYEFKNIWMSDKQTEIYNVSKLTNKIVGDVTYGLVSIKYVKRNNNQGSKTIRECGTEVWILEAGKWKYLMIPPAKWQNILAAFDYGYYAKSAELAEKILIENPFSTRAYNTLFFSMKKGQMLRSPVGNLKPSDIADKLQSINPDDTSVIEVAGSL